MFKIKQINAPAVGFKKILFLKRNSFIQGNLHMTRLYLINNSAPNMIFFNARKYDFFKQHKSNVFRMVSDFCMVSQYHTGTRRAEY